MIYPDLRSVKGLSVLALLYSLHLFSDVSQSDSLYLERLLEHALECRSDIRAQDETIEKIRQQEWVIASGLFPHVDLKGTVQKSKEDAYAERILQANFSQVLFEPDGAIMEREVARLNTKIATFQRQDLQNRIRLDVTRNFFNYRTRLYEEAAQNALDQSSSIEYKSALRKKIIGLYSDPQMQQAEAQFRNAKTKVFSLANDRKAGKEHVISSTENSLERALAIPDTRLVLDALWKEIEHHDTETLIKQALKYRTEFAILDAQIEQAEIRTDIARYYYLPSISFNATTYAYHFDSGTTVLEAGLGADLLYPWTVGLSAQWSFDSFGSLHSVRSARAERMEKILTRKRTEFEVKDAVITSHLALQNAAESVRSGLSSLEQARIDFFKSVKSFEVGLLSEVEFKKAKTTWERAQAELENTLNSAVNKHEELLFNAGYPPGPSQLQHLPISPLKNPSDFDTSR
ncbi:TPA: hypothetical protein DDZ86_01770 [Candidatus Dependentiae bacterium]|nr:MAG: hypothetical protein UW09_C0001G0283 [candidate division TM6 bacterium GW2011_GWF2_43_87]HBL98352.1 hypothetical protein [Candidatus Dependentiae bacterium]